MYSIAYMRKTRSAARLSGLKRRITTVNGAADKEWDECLPASSGTAKHFSGSKGEEFPWASWRSQLPPCNFFVFN